MKRYRVEHTNGDKTVVNGARLEGIFEAISLGSKFYTLMGEGQAKMIFNLDHVVGVWEEEPVDTASHVVTPPTPDAIKRQEEYKKQQDMSSVEGLVKRHEEREA